jgi:hypothetical protein
LRLVWFAKEAGLAGLLDELRDAVLPCNSERLGIVVIVWNQGEGLFELNLSCPRIIAIEQLGARDESVVCLLSLMATGLGALGMIGSRWSLRGGSSGRRRDYRLTYVLRARSQGAGYNKNKRGSN